MTRWLYIRLLWLHPRTFRQRFGDEMLGIFDQSSEKLPLLADGFLSLARQWALRPPAVAYSATTAGDGVPLFCSTEHEVPPVSALIRGALISFFLFGTICFAISHRWQQTGLIVGSHHPSPSHLLAVRTEAQPVADLPAEIKMKPYPFHPAVSAYFRLILVLSALDADADNMISAAEIEDAPAALWKLDTNHDGKLSAEECGFKAVPEVDLQRARLTFMRVHPVLAVLDANHDGELSGSEIRNAAAALRILDANGDGKLVERELLPNRAIAMAAEIMLMLDKNGDGRITPDERVGTLAARIREVLDRADRNGKGFVTEDDLVIRLTAEMR